MTQGSSAKLVAVMGVGSRRGRRLTCAGLASAASLAGVVAGVAANHAATQAFVSRETPATEPQVMFGVLDWGETGVSEILGAAKRVVVATWGGSDVEDSLSQVVSRLVDEHGFPGGTVSVVFHEPNLNPRMVKTLARIDRLPFGGRVYCVGAFSREYHDAAGVGLAPDVALGEEPAMAMFAELWMELRL